MKKTGWILTGLLLAFLLPASVAPKLMGAQAALFSPAKMGSIPEMLPSGRISAANAPDAGDGGAEFALVFRRAALPASPLSETYPAAPAPRWPAATGG